MWPYIPILDRGCAECRFNDRGEDWLQQVSSNEDTNASQRDYSTVSSLGFNEKDEDRTVTVPSNKGSIQNPLERTIEFSMGFNDKTQVEDIIRTPYNQSVKLTAY